MIQRHQLLSQSKICIQRNPADADLTIEDFQGMVGRMSSIQLHMVPGNIGILVTKNSRHSCSKREVLLSFSL